MGDKILKLDKISFGYDNNLLFKNINFTMGKGDFVGLVGSNGAGKTTLIQLILGRLTPLAGTITINGDPVSQSLKNNKIGYVPQLGVESALRFPITVYELVSLSFYSEWKGIKKLNMEQKDKILQVLKVVGLEKRKDTLFGKLSGGQRQRALIAKAIVNGPNFLVFDEPTTGIDEATRKELYQLLHHFNKDHRVSILMITHELTEIKKFMTKVYSLEQGELREVC